MGLALKKSIQASVITPLAIRGSIAYNLYLATRIPYLYGTRGTENCDRILFSTQEALDLVTRNVNPTFGKTRVVSHSYDQTLYPAVRKKHDGPITFRYIGSFYGRRTPEPLFRALDYLAKSNPELLKRMRIELVGAESTEFSRIRLERFAEGLPDGVVRLASQETYLDSLKTMSAADVLLVIDADYEKNVFLPSKLIDYLGAGRHYRDYHARAVFDY